MDKSKKTYKKWCESAFIDKEDINALKEMDEVEIKDAFYRLIPFGTSGMRDEMGLGTNKVNRYTIRLASAGLAKMLGRDKKVLIAYDTRNFSYEFAIETARVLIHFGLKADIFKTCTPTPVLSYGIRRMNYDAGVVITASHNSRRYNGFKTYDSRGIQMSPGFTELIASNMQKTSLAECDFNKEDIKIGTASDKIHKGFVDEIINCSKYDDSEAKRKLKVVYTPLFGTARDYILAALNKDGFEDVNLIYEESGFNGDFPGLFAPNPEDRRVFKFAEKEVLDTGADIAIATDPDGDRIGVGVLEDGEMVYLSANQIGALLIDFISARENIRDKILVTSIVTSDIGTKIARMKDAKVIRTLVGSKYICDKIYELDSDKLLLGYEESCGFNLCSQFGDKDSVSAALVICEMAAYHKKNGRTLASRMRELYDEYGYYIDENDSYVFEGYEGAKKIRRIMQHIRKTKNIDVFETSIENQKIDYIEGQGGLPPADLIKIKYEDSWVCIRPSGTEPKIKIYYCIKGENYHLAQGKLNSVIKKIDLLIEDMV